MIFCFSGTGNSRYIAQRIAEALQKTVIDLNARIKDNDTTTVDTGSDVVMVTPTYAWRIPKIVSEWMAKTKWTGAKRIWFVMDCGSEIGNAGGVLMDNEKIFKNELKKAHIESIKTYEGYSGQRGCIDT